MFKAAESGGVISNWLHDDTSINHVLCRELDVLRSRSREQAVNNSYIRKAIDLYKQNVVGPDGILVQSRIKSKGGKLKKVINEKFELAFHEWSQPEYCTVTGPKVRKH